MNLFGADTVTIQGSENRIKAVEEFSEKHGTPLSYFDLPEDPNLYKEQRTAAMYNLRSMYEANRKRIEALIAKGMKNYTPQDAQTLVNLDDNFRKSTEAVQIKWMDDPGFLTESFKQELEAAWRKIDSMYETIAAWNSKLGYAVRPLASRIIDGQRVIVDVESGETVATEEEYKKWLNEKPPVKSGVSPLLILAGVATAYFALRG
jgi:acyl-CoA reductase-like NAD-dependent aldehyde dehydrogenase